MENDFLSEVNASAKERANDLREKGIPEPYCSPDAVAIGWLTPIPQKYRKLLNHAVKVMDSASDYYGALRCMVAEGDAAAIRKFAASEVWDKIAPTASNKETYAAEVRNALNRLADVVGSASAE